MASKTLPYLVVAGGAFLGGLALGLLISPNTGRENRALLRRKSTDVAEMVANRTRTVRGRVAKEVKKAVPDLYEATSHLDLDENDLMTGRG
jgi:gas vesicle protein